MPPRVIVTALDPASGRATLSRDESRYVARVLRLAAGDRLTVFDGAGREFDARIDAVTRDRVDLSLVGPSRPRLELRTRVVLAQCVLKGHNMDAVVRDATMLGVAAIQPALSARTLLSAAAIDRGRLVDRWHRVAVASARQCGRAVVPDVRPAAAIERLLGEKADCRLILAEPATGRGATSRPVPAAPPVEALLLVGPEGGWTDAEIRAAEARGFAAWSLGPTTLRADAEPLVALSVLQYLWSAE